MCSYIANLGEQSTSAEVLALVNLTALGIGVVKKTGTSTFEVSTVSTNITETEEAGYRVFNFGDMPVKLKVKNAGNSGYTYLTFEGGQIIASDS